MKTTELIVIILYLVLMLAIGLICRKRAQSSTSGFWSADASVLWYVNAFAILATIMSGGGMMGNIGVAATLGAAYVGMSTFGTCTGVGLASLIVAPPLRRSKAKTLSDFFHIRYENKKVGYLVALVIVIAYTVYLVSQMKASGTLGEYVLGVNYTTAMIVTWIVFTLYTILGGMLAVTWTDFIQGVLMIFAVVVCAGSALVTFGGLGNLYAEATAVFPEIGILHLPFVSYLGFFLVWFLVNMCGPTVLMRVATAKSPFSAGFAMNAAMFLLAIFTTGTLFITAPAAKIMAGSEPLANNDAYLMVFMENSFGPVMKGIIGAAIFAAIMSTTAGLLLAAGAALSNDIVAKVKNLTPKAEQKSAIICCIAVSLVVLAFSFNPPDLLVILYSKAMNFLMVCLFAPFMAGLWWKRATPTGAMLAIILGGISYAIVVFGIKTLPPFSETFISLPLSFLGLIVGSLMTQGPSEEKRREIDNWHVAETGEVANI